MCVLEPLWPWGPSLLWGHCCSPDGDLWHWTLPHKLLKPTCSLCGFLTTGRAIFSFFFKEELCVLNENPWGYFRSFHRMSEFKPGNKRINPPRRKSEPFTAREGPCITPGMLITLLQPACQNTGGRQIFKAKSWPRSNISSQVLCPEITEEMQLCKCS